MKYVMKRMIFTFEMIFSLVLFLSVSSVFAQEGAPNLIAPGIMTTIQPCLSYDETFTRFDLVEFLGKERTYPDEELKKDVKFNPEFWAKDNRFTRDIWCLEFSFKPIRMIWIDVPGKNGVSEKKQVWYMIYSVTNTGQALRTTLDEKLTYPEQTTIKVKSCTCAICSEAGVEPSEEDVPVNLPPEIGNQFGTYKPEFVETSITFAPNFILATGSLLTNFKSQVDEKTGEIITEEERSVASYHDQMIPLALEPIARRESLGTQLETTVTISTKEIKPHETLWGVATWTDVDPRINQFSVIIAGLTNAYRWREKTPEDEEMNFQAISGVANDPLIQSTAKLIKDSQDVMKKTFATENGVFAQKVLRLNFWRPGDQYDVNERQIRYGLAGEPDYEWYYRLME